MTFNKLFAASLCLAMGVTMAANAQTTTPATTTKMDPSYRGTINVDVVEQDNKMFIDRINTNLVERPAPQVGQTRAAIEALYGPAQTALAPNKEYSIYTNEMDLTDGRMFQRNLETESLRIYEVSYNKTGNVMSANDKAVDVKLRVIPRIGDHKNLVYKMMGEPMNNYRDQQGQHVVYGIPKERWAYYSDVLDDPFTAVNTYFNAEGFMVGQEFMPGRWNGGYVITSANRHVFFDTDHQQDVKVSW